LSTMVGAPAREAGAWLADQIRYRRFRTQVKILTRATEQLREAGLDPKAVDLSVLVPLLEDGSLLQEDDPMVDRWASLLAAAAADPDDVPPSYPDILRQLTPHEAALLDGIYETSGRFWPEASYELTLIADRFGVPGDRVGLAQENLLRLRLLR